ncbi:phosphatidylserine/phosphatidylglycerophosphate/cardiolipin synthase family protein [Stakelama sp. CBK3Z-3]|uniref:Phospholipase D n=1 Tax=Stakelama flava TaxID=2860338 RepID=A0ABS6XP67_9SPHN|nr:phospholipase D-like domain-containing protein [Stakelama flava]MBW4332002.1 phosphatidylserine/phosphatidylglycerophosphate/cardiolipin synthase family protein [Stakelama flava]
MQAPPDQPTFTVDGNHLTLLDTGPRRLDALIALIDGAQTSLRFLYYIYVDDSVGTKVRDALIAAVARGVQVSLIVDALGSDKADDHHFFDPLQRAGATVSRFVPRLGRRYLLRNHQKMAIADEARAIVGGFNIQDSYFGTLDQHAWRDLGLLVDGPAAARLAGYFDALERWTRRSKASLRALSRTLNDWSEESGNARWLLGGPTHRLSPWARTIKREMDRALRIDLIAGYFAPGPAMLRRLDRAGKRGQVRLILPSKTDHGAAIWASRFTYAGLLRKKVRIYEYQPTKLHTKLFVIGDVVHIGSANFDVRSMFLNLELMLRVEDRAFAAHARAYVDTEVANSAEMTRDYYKQFTTPWRRVKQAAAYFVMAILDYTVTRRLNFGDD